MNKSKNNTASSTIEAVAVEEATPKDRSFELKEEIKASLEEIKDYEGVVGYILRNTKSAAIDLKDPTKLIDYAGLSSSTNDLTVELSDLFDLGEVKNIVIEGTQLKMFSLTIKKNKISVFMGKTVDTSKIEKKLHKP